MASRQVHTPLRILIVEDHPVISRMLEVTLESLGQRVVGVAADAAGVRRHDVGPIDLAIVDVNLADGPTGLAIAAYLSKEGVAVVFHTTDPGRIPAGFPHALGLLEKPFTLKGLCEVVQLAGSYRRRRGGASGAA
ncbi:MAG TPA: response regulator [Caulobacteraceae bacterium]|jgi:DNA-binding response OmpR family regulator